MNQAPSDGELLLYTYHGSCGHRRQSGLPCATPKCKQGSEQDILDMGSVLNSHIIFSRTTVKFGDDDIVIWKRFVVG